MHCKSPNTTRHDSATPSVAGILRSHLLPTSHAYIVITHDIDSAIRIADTIGVLARDFDAQGQPIAGARIQSTIDLIGLGLAPGHCIHPSVLCVEYRVEKNLQSSVHVYYSTSTHRCKP